MKRLVEVDISNDPELCNGANSERCRFLDDNDYWCLLFDCHLIDTGHASTWAKCEECKEGKC